jgi:exonuclease VII small subunit
MSETRFPLQKKIEELEEIEGYFQRPDMDLEVAITKHQDALKVAKEIVTYLDKVESTIEKIDLKGII